MAGPRLKRVMREDFQEAPDWFARFLDTLNPFLGDTTSTLAGNLTRENLRRQVETIRIETGVSIPATFAGGLVRVKNKLGAKPTEVRIGQVSPVAEISGWISPTFQNSWADYGSPNDTVAFKKDVMGRLLLKGVAVGGSIGVAMFTLPVGYRPSVRQIIGTTSNSVHGEIVIETSGEVVPTVGSNVYFGLAGLSVEIDELPPPSLRWEPLQNGAIRIDHIPGLNISSTYDVTLIIE